MVTERFICKVQVGKRHKPMTQYHKANYDGMRMWLGQIHWHKELASVDVDGKWKKFCGILNKAVEKFMSLGYRRSKKFPKWMNNEAKAERKYKSKMWNRYRSQEHALIC